LNASVEDRDHWAQWLLERRFGGDPEQPERTLRELGPVRDRVLGNADVKEGDVLLDVGTGDGLIGFGALDRVGSTGRVIFTDVSEDLLSQCREIAAGRGDASRCEFIVAPAEDLHGLRDESVDVVTTRSVLIYVDDKRRAFEEFHRVLRGGGRASTFEPVNRFDFENRRPTDFWGYDLSAIPEIVAKVNRAYREAGPPLTENAMFNFDERDLLGAARAAGFRFLRLEYEAVIESTPPLGGRFHGRRSRARRETRTRRPSRKSSPARSIRPRRRRLSTTFGRLSSAARDSDAGPSRTSRRRSDRAAPARPKIGRWTCDAATKLLGTSAAGRFLGFSSRPGSVPSASP
jgi:ubiquinone/menaquinone biosynthesis C-methylase UbiE